MANKVIIKSLKRMHRFESASAQVYRGQGKIFSRQGKKNKWDIARKNEEEHIREIKNRIEGMGEKAPFISALFSMGGFLLGLLGFFWGLKRSLKINILLEEKAVENYERYLKNIPFSSETERLLQKIIREEEEHIAMWREGIKNIS
jgi:demethoxyubiquinone hydroxylase (CLK1/Coq7/Cat5 family)